MSLPTQVKHTLLAAITITSMALIPIGAAFAQDPARMKFAPGETLVVPGNAVITKSTMHVDPNTGKKTPDITCSEPGDDPAIPAQMKCITAGPYGGECFYECRPHKEKGAKGGGVK